MRLPMDVSSHLVMSRLPMQESGGKWMNASETEVKQKRMNNMLRSETDFTY